MDDQYKTRKTLIQRMQDGHDEQSWEDFIRTYRPYIHAIIRSMNISDFDADDIVQQIMLKIWKNIGEVDLEQRQLFRGWLRTVTKNSVKDFIRKRTLDAKRLEKAQQEEARSYLNSIRLPDIEKIADQEWGAHVFNLAMERIDGVFSGKAMQVFQLSMEGVSVEEIARKMDLKENSVYRLRNRVKVQLAQEVELLRAELE